VDYRTHAPLALPWTPCAMQMVAGKCGVTLTKKTFQRMRRTLADLKTKIEGSRSAALSTFPQPDFSWKDLGKIDSSGGRANN